MMKKDLDFIISEYIMTKRPFIFVEGRDDIKVYSNQMKLARREDQIDIYAAETVYNDKELKFFKDGCEGVIKIAKELKEKKKNLDKCSRCIIDRDTKDFRDHITEAREYICMLDYYSYENYFFKSTFIKEVLEYFTDMDKLEKRNIYYKIHENQRKQKENEFYILYLGYIESLKKALNKEYDSTLQFSYGFSLFDKNGKEILEKIWSKKEELEEYAKQLGLEFNFRTLKKSVKGKWLIRIFAKVLVDKTQNLKNLCKENKIKQCPMCRAGKNDKCLYKPKKDLSISDIETYIFSKKNIRIKKVIKMLKTLN